jgi:predicted nucleotidyltransferase
MNTKLSPEDTADQDNSLRTILARVIDRYHPLEVWLFGSRFRGDFEALSDWDILVLVEDQADDTVFDPYVAWETSRDCGIPVDIVVDTWSDFYGSVGVANSLAREIQNERRILFKR